MRDLRVGDKVDLKDPSYGFGINGGEYVTTIYNRNNLTVIEVGLKTLKTANNCTISKIGKNYDEVCNILVTDGEGSFWFTQTKFVNLCNPEHTVSFDGGEPVTISDQSYQELKKHFTQ